MARRRAVWHADTEATHHMSDQRSLFTPFRELPMGSWKVNGVGAAELFALGIGNVAVVTEVEGLKIEGEFRDVLFIPDLGMNLFSNGVATANNVNVYSPTQRCLFYF